MNTGTQDPSQLFGYEVTDTQGQKIGTVDNVWVDDATSELEFVGVKMGFLMGKTHIIPTADAQISGNTITVPFEHDKIKGAPHFSGDEELSTEQEQEVYSYYGIQRSESASPTGLAGGTGGFGGTDTTREYDTAGTGERSTGIATEGDNAERTAVTLSEEQLQVGKREQEAGRVRLRKVVRTEHQEVPVELRREEVQIERISGEGTAVPGDAFQEKNIEVPVMREEAVVGKESRVTEQVQINKNVQTETRNVGGEVRREDVEVEGGNQEFVTNRGETTRDSGFNR